jgi:hypothetical protein
MKYLPSIIFAMLAFIFSSAQQATPTVISTTGSFSQIPGGSVSATVGEMAMVKTFSGGGTILNQGFEQPNQSVAGLLDVVDNDKGSFAVHPNPAIDNLWFGFQFTERGRVSVSVYTTDGQKTADVYVAECASGKTVHQLNLSAYAAGTYVISAAFTSNTTGKTELISKKFVVVK